MSGGDGEFFLEALLFEEAGVVAVAGEEFVVCAQFGDAAGYEDGDLVGVAGGGDAVGDEDGGPALHDGAKAVEDALFGVGVDAGEGVVEDEDARVADDGAGDGGALLLAAGEGDAALADHGVEALGELEDLGGDVGDGGGFLDLFSSCLGDTEGDVLADGLGEEEGLLRDVAYVFAQGVEGEAADGFSVDEDGTGSGIVKAGDEANEGGFARAGRAYDGEAGAGGDAEVDVFEDGWCVRVGEG